jgi:DNA-binding NarL/FixJ family response regulator
MITNVAIVEDNAAVAASLEQAIVASGNCRCVCTSGDGEHALRVIPKHRPHVVVMDIELPGISGIECTARLKRILPETQILILTVYTDTQQIFRALAAGANGYLLKRATPDEISRSILDVRSGGSPMSAEIARKVVQSFHKPAAANALESLSPREAEILGFLAQAYTSKEIAAHLGISYETVCSHLGNIYGKLHVRSRTEAVIKYLQSPDTSANS